MKLNKIFALIMLVLLTTALAAEVQDRHRPALDHSSASKTVLTLNARSNKRGLIQKSLMGQTIFDSDVKTQRLLKYFKEELPAAIAQKSPYNGREGVFDAGINLSSTSPNWKLTTHGVKEKRIKSDLDIKAKKPPKKVLLPTASSFQNIYCRLIKQRPRNIEGNLLKSSLGSCDENVLAVTSPPTLLEFRNKKPMIPNDPGFSLRQNQKEKRYERLTSSTAPSGINCRRVMNSELNEHGDIIDSVALVCDRPTSTSTTTSLPTTTKPTMTTTPKATRTTTTTNPKVKVCRPVMNSYLNGEGEIMDSVRMV